MQLSFNPRLHRRILLGLDFAFEAFSDKEKFSQATTGGQRSSRVGMLYGSVAAGLVSPPLSRFELALSVGSDWVAGKRSIENCVDCHSEDLDLHGGLFLEPLILMGLGGRQNVRVSLGLSYRDYPGDSDLASRTFVKVLISGQN